MFDENLKKQFFDRYKFSNHDINKFTLMNTWMIGKNSLQLYYLTLYCRHLNMENIIDADYTETKRVSKDSRKILQNIKICFFKVIHCC